MVVAGNSEIGRDQRVMGCPCVEPLVGDGIHGGGGARFAHPCTLGLASERFSSFVDAGHLRVTPQRGSGKRTTGWDASSFEGWFQLAGGSQISWCQENVGRKGPRECPRSRCRARSSSSTATR